MKISLDYDETYTADPVLWSVFIKQAKQRSHEVKFVTYRYSPNVYGENGVDSRNQDIFDDSIKEGIEIVYTNGKQKSNFYDADIWIDDYPETIPSSHTMSIMVSGCILQKDI